MKIGREPTKSHTKQQQLFQEQLANHPTNISRQSVSKFGKVAIAVQEGSDKLIALANFSCSMDEED